MNRKKNYKDLDKWRKVVRAQRKRYYSKTQNARNSWKPWTPEDIRLVIEHSMPDSELAILIGRSIGAIQQRRMIEKKAKFKENIENTAN